MTRQATFLVLGATGGTGKDVVAQALADGRTVRALARSPGKLPSGKPNLEVRQGSITDEIDTGRLVEERLVPSMRRYGVKRFLYQPGGLSRPYGGHLPPL